MVSSNDLSLAAQILLEVQAEVAERVTKEPQNWWLVKDVAYLYKEKYLRVKSERAAMSILAPLGLDSETYISRQKEMNPEMVKQIATELINYQLPSTAIIFAGVDTTGPNLYVANDAEISWCNPAGFATIGSGSWHAQSTFMVAGHTRFSLLPRTLFITYIAKKRAELAPGVGPDTDMFGIGPALGSLKSFEQTVIQGMDKIYGAWNIKLSECFTEVEKEVNKYAEQVSAALPTAPKQIGPPA